MMYWTRILVFAVCAAMLGACSDWKVDSAALTARNATVAAGPDCASCHGYPLLDQNHDYHLNDAQGNKDLNGTITCMDCHSQSIKFRSVVLFDSIYEDTTGEKWRTLAHPHPGDKTTGGTVIRSMTFFGVDTLPQHQPIRMPARSGSKPKFQEFVTALAHMNEQVDVVFDSRNSDPARFSGDSASYNPSQESCSAIACHPGDKSYSWGSAAKGLPELKEDEGPNL